MVVLMLGAGLCLLLLLLSLAVRLRLGIPLVYVLLMLTVFHGWYQAHTALADGILLPLVGAAAERKSGVEGKGVEPGWRRTL